jgi:hypothetical protein
MFDTNRAPILRQDWHYLQMDQNEVPVEPRYQGRAYGMFGANRAPILRQD